MNRPWRGLSEADRLIRSLRTLFLRVEEFSCLNVFTPATSLGDVESLAEHRETVEGPNSIVPENLIRFSIGIEDVADLIADLEQALADV